MSDTDDGGGSVAEALDRACEYANGKSNVRAERVRLNGYGWLSLAGGKNAVKEVVDLLTANNDRLVVRKVPTADPLAVRVAKDTNPYVFRWV